MNAHLHPVSDGEGRGNPAPSGRIARIIYCEAEAVKFEDSTKEHLKLAREDFQTSEDFKYEAARLIWEERRDGKSLRQLAAEIGRDHKHVYFMQQCHEARLRGLKSPAPRPKFNELYNSAEVRAAKERKAEERRKAAEAQLAKTQQAIKDIQSETGHTPSARQVSRQTGRDDKSISKDWDELHKQGRAPKRPVQEQSKPKPPPQKAQQQSKSKDWQRKTGKPNTKLETAEAYLRVKAFQHRLERACSALEEYSPSDIDFIENDELRLDRVTEVWEDMIELGEWWERTMMYVQGYLDDHKVLVKIKKLRSIEGCMPEEAATRNRVADKLERKMRSRLRSAG